ncbi:unnamed protein product [Mycena citricolor]|uniref:Uncharacterized protein n=1 Tax=Mycena citricolor TaxID=2018698 RepID=A0AAD2K2J3_9AGAR|nr:unnamed protein product [Mycena citricolor]
MTTRTQTSSPFARLSLMRKGSQSARAREAYRAPAVDDNYIPYNGPVEAPPPRRQERGRDSWGDPVYEDDGDHLIQELHQRYATDLSRDPWHGEVEERIGRPRARTHSGFSGRTVSSGTVDPHIPNIGAFRKSSVTADGRPPVPSYINLDKSGGVGESPVPFTRTSRDVPPQKRSSLATIFTFGQSSKKNPLSPTKVPLPVSPAAKTDPASFSSMYNPPQAQMPTGSGPPSIYSVSSQRRSNLDSHDVDAYHSYYNYTPAADQFGTLDAPRNALTSPHPYSYNLIHEPPPTAPLIISPKLKFDVIQDESLDPRVRMLKNSTSTPNLRSGSRSPNRLRKPGPPSKLKDRWLSPETWCDAVMFPRPRLKIEGLNGRVVSPPGSPVSGGFDAHENHYKPPGIASRVLAHSRSIASLRSSEAGPSTRRNEPPVLPPIVVSPTRLERPPRPKSFALDDLALPSPVPSLARVLEEGQILEHQRKKWQTQATGSFQNTRSRSLSRSRAKSLTHRGESGPQGNMAFLAARSLVGNQQLVPVLPKRTHVRTGSQTGTSTGANTFNSRSSHSHSNSLVKTVSKSLHGHTRQESWGKSALKKAAGICYPDLSPAEEENGLESALRGGGTKVIRLADPAMLPVDRVSHRNGPSPVPSTVSDTRMGIALSTPPPNDSSSFESLHLPSHPYAQGAVSYSSYQPSSTSKGADYAGPHPAVAIPHADPQDLSARHRLPPQAYVGGSTHPYASQRDSFPVVSQPRTDSNVPAQSKMWAQLSPGIVREILPGDLMYSPYTSERDSTSSSPSPANRKSTLTILDTIGLGETLVNAMEQNRDSGLGTSEGHEGGKTVGEWIDEEEQASAMEGHPYRVRRKASQHDEALPETPHTNKSSPVDPSMSHARLIPDSPPPLPRSSPAMNSEESSPPRSPPLVANGDDDNLDEFRDLFYRPNMTDEILTHLSRPTSTRQNSVTWDIGSTTRTRTGSGLTSLARQFSHEFEEMRAMRMSMAGSADSQSSISRFSRFPTDQDIHFIFTDEMEQSIIDPVRPEEETMSAFHPSIHKLPDDVESYRTSSPVDETLRLGSVGSGLTPRIESSGDHRQSLTGELSPGPAAAPKSAPIPVPRNSLQPNSVDPTRSSYMTESSISRISNLSDFPSPPSPTAAAAAGGGHGHMTTPAHMSLLSSYFHDFHEAVAEHAASEESPAAPPFTPRLGQRF